MDSVAEVQRWVVYTDVDQSTVPWLDFGTRTCILRSSRLFELFSQGLGAGSFERRDTQCIQSDFFSFPKAVQRNFK